MTNHHFIRTRRNQAKNCFSRYGVLLLCGSFFAGAPSVEAGEISTNWTWLHMALDVPQTNVIAGLSVPASIIISNTTSEDSHNILWATGDPCNCGFGTLIIHEVSTGKEIECKIPEWQRGNIIGSYWPQIKAHQSRSFNFDLASFAMTNIGTYSIQAEGRFRLYNLSTNTEEAVVTTSPIFVSVLADTNSSSNK